MHEFLSTMWHNFLSIVNTVSFVDLIDIGVVAYLIYKAIHLVRETRAGQLVKGLLVLSASYLLSVQIGLKTISFILVNIFQFGILAIFVVFQPELRRALEQVGRSKISNLTVFSGAPELQAEQARIASMIDAMCDAALSLSRQKIGALIVFEKQTKLGDIINSGTVIDAGPSPELIGNIFFPNSPLHDGAMVVRMGRLYAAGCFLPLSDNQLISRELGTRHRAGLGMSENSDAVILIVSEETGRISIAQNGVLKQNLDYQLLKSTLQHELLPEKPETSEKKSVFWKVKHK